MAHPAELIPPGAAAAWQRDDEAATLRHLRRARAAWPPDSPQWATLERLCGLVLIHQLREVEGTFALERADAVLDAAHWPRPALEWLAPQQPGDEQAGE